MDSSVTILAIWWFFDDFDVTIVTIVTFSHFSLHVSPVRRPRGRQITRQGGPGEPGRVPTATGPVSRRLLSWTAWRTPRKEFHMEPVAVGPVIGRKVCVICFSGRWTMNRS